MIVRLLRHGDDRMALAEAYPGWKETIAREERLRSLTFDPSDSFGYDAEGFLALFEGGLLRRRQFLQEVNIKMLYGGERGEPLLPCGT